MSKPDYIYKAAIIESGFCEIENQLSYNAFLGDEESSSLWNELRCSNNDFKEAIKINHCSLIRSRRLYNRINSMLVKGQCYFLTLTFKDDVFQSTNSDTRKRYVKRYLKDNALEYVANVDFGALGAREHYHAVVYTADIVNLRNWHVYGAIKLEKIRVSNKDSKNIAKYISKLTNHAIKSTTRRCSIIYSR